MSVAYSAASVTVKDGATSAVFTVNRTGTKSELSKQTKVNYATADVTAVAGTDYTATSGSLTFPSGATEETVTVAISGDAYQNTATKSFLLDLTGYGAATGNISPDTGSNTKQTYLYVPDDDNSQLIPTAKKPGDNLKYQAVYSGFADPQATETSIEMPLGYIRLGYARDDMNFYERVVLNSDGYHPTWQGTKSDGTPIEPGTMENFMLPRGIDRKDLSSTEVDDDMKDNAHLDGIFLYSDKNYTVTVNNNYNQIIQGTYVHYVEGRSHQMYMGTETKWTYVDGPDALRSAQGTDEIAGDIWDYSITSTRKLSIDANRVAAYELDTHFSAYAGAVLDVSNNVKYSVSNSINMNVKGVQAEITADIYGNFAIDTPFGGYTSTKAKICHSVNQSIMLTVNSGESTTWTTPVKVAAAANALAGAGATTAGWLDHFATDGSFFKNVTGEGLSTTYNDAFVSDTPNIMGGLAAATAAMVVVCAAAQKAAQVAPSIQPKLEMSRTSIKLSCGPDNFIDISDAGILLVGESISLAGDDVDIDSETTMTFDAPTSITATSPEMTISTYLEVPNFTADEGMVTGEFLAGTVTTA